MLVLPWLLLGAISGAVVEGLSITVNIKVWCSILSVLCLVARKQASKLTENISKWIRTSVNVFALHAIKSRHSVGLTLLTLLSVVSVCSIASITAA